MWTRCTDSTVSPRSTSTTHRPLFTRSSSPQALPPPLKLRRASEHSSPGYPHESDELYCDTAALGFDEHTVQRFARQIPFRRHRLQVGLEPGLHLVELLPDGGDVLGGAGHVLGLAPDPAHAARRR